MARMSGWLGLNGWVGESAGTEIELLEIAMQEHDDRTAAAIEAEATENFISQTEKRASAPLSDEDENAFVKALAPLLSSASVITTSPDHAALDTAMGIVSLYTSIGPQSSLTRIAVDGAQIHLSPEAIERIDALWTQARRQRALIDMDTKRREHLRSLTAAATKE